MEKYQNISVKEVREFIDLFDYSTDDYQYFLDFKANYYYIAPHALKRFALGKNEFYDAYEHHSAFVYKDDLEVLQAELLDLMQSDRCVHNMQYRWLDLDGNPIWINCRGYVVRDDDGTAKYMFGCINEIGVKQKADNVSGLLGESSLKEYLESLNGRFPEGYMLHLGINDFKEINEKFGLEYGEMILRETASCISGCLSDGQRLYKLVADEFLVLDFTGGSPTDAEALFERIREAVGQFVENNAYEVVFTISGGVLPCDKIYIPTYSNSIKLSEFSLNEAKRGRMTNCYLFCQKDYDAFLRRRKLSRILRKSINHGFEGFEAYYQPLYQTSNGSLYGAEVLMRFSSEECGSVPPVEFIPILEETGLIIPAGRWILREALEKCKEIQKTIPDFHISINISHVQVSKTNLIQEIMSAVKESGLASSAAIMELTESGLLEANKNATKLWSDLDNYGIKLALDDFGTGYSNFHYLSELKPGIIKIDRSFVAKALENEAEFHLLYLLCSMTHNLKLKLCIEGIENEKEWERVQSLQPDYGQGYFWGRPCPYDRFVEQFVKASIN